MSLYSFVLEIPQVNASVLHNTVRNELNRNPSLINLKQ